MAWWPGASPPLTGRWAGGRWDRRSRSDRGLVPLQLGRPRLGDTRRRGPDRPVDAESGHRCGRGPRHAHRPRPAPPPRRRLPVRHDRRGRRPPVGAAPRSGRRRRQPRQQAEMAGRRVRRRVGHLCPAGPHQRPSVAPGRRAVPGRQRGRGHVRPGVERDAPRAGQPRPDRRRLEPGHGRRLPGCRHDPGPGPGPGPIPRDPGTLEVGRGAHLFPDRGRLVGWVRAPLGPAPAPQAPADPDPDT